MLWLLGLLTIAVAISSAVGTRRIGRLHDLSHLPYVLLEMLLCCPARAVRHGETIPPIRM